MKSASLLVLYAVISPLISCSTTPPMPDPQMTHPASPLAVEAPYPERHLLTEEPPPPVTPMEEPATPPPAHERDHGGMQ